MPRKNLVGGWGDHRPMSVRLTMSDRSAMHELEDAWACTASEVLRRALRLAIKDHRQRSRKTKR